EACARAVLDAARKRDQGERAADRQSNSKDRQSGPDRSSCKIAQRQARQVHVTASPTIEGAATALPASRMLPSLIRTRRGHRAASASLWVTSTIVIRGFSRSLNSKSATRAALALSRLPVGSSASSSVGSLTRA